ncbi:MAG TPA: serine/threonine-protein kinase [Kofleriaceae bacterium]|nr:serine/threonine-protein kinase [Kofleriaceae bacterium]
MLSPSAPLALGDMVLDRYRAVEHIANGGHSVVYLGRDERLARPVCIKVYMRYPGDPGISQTSYEHFVQEAFALSRLTHPNTLRIYDFGHLAGDPAHDEDKIPFHVSEYMNGGTLSQLIRERGSQPASEMLRIATAVADALSEAHSVGIIHRDLKPQNILFNALGTTRLAKLADFGIAKWLEDQDGEHGESTGDHDGGFARAGDTQVVSGQKMAMYSPSWAAPEQLAGQTVGPSADIYSLALMAIYMLTGRAIFTDDDVYEGYRKRKSAASIVDMALEPLGLPRAAITLLQQATSFEPTVRPQKAAEFGIALSEAFQTSHDSVVETAKLPKLEAVLSERPIRAASRGTRRVSVAPGTVDVAGRAARFAPLTDGVADVAGLNGAARLRITFLPAATGRRQVHIKGMSVFVAKHGGRPATAVQVDDDAMLDLVGPGNSSVGRLRITVGTPAAGHTVFRFGDEQVAIGTEECPDVILADFGQGAEAAFIYTPGVLPEPLGKRRRQT